MEEHHKSVAFTFGRFSPPTVGHKKLVDRVVNHAKKMHGDHYIFASHSHDKEKNPLSHHQKIGFMKKMFPHANIHDGEHVKTVIDALKHLHKKGYTHVHMHVGGDRKQEFHNLVHKYNGEGKEYNFKHLEVHSAGHRDPEAKGVDGMSASKMRHHAAKGEFHHFARGVPVKAHAKELYHAVRKGMHVENFSDNKALFIVGGPACGKDFILNAINHENRLLETPLDKIYKAIQERYDLPELVDNPALIVNGTAENLSKIRTTKTILEHMGYETAMVYVYTNNEESKARNDLRASKGAKTFSESVRSMKYVHSTQNIHDFKKLFETFLIFDNSYDLSILTEQRQIEIHGWLTELGEAVSNFFEWKSKSRPGMKTPTQVPVPSSEKNRESNLIGYERVKQGNIWVLKPKKVSESIDDLFEAAIKTKSKKPLAGDRQGGIAMSSKNMSEPPCVEEVEPIKKKKKTKAATPPPNFFDGKMGAVPSGGVGLTSSYEPKGKLFSEIRGK